MTMVSNSTISICAGVAGALFVGYCIYFDQKRRSDPNFRKKLREKRRNAKQSGSSAVKWPNMRDQEDIHKFFLTQIQAGEELLGVGDIEEGVAHLSRAVAICGQPQQLLSVMQQTLPPKVFQLLVQALPVAGKSVLEAAGGAGSEKQIKEEDLE